MIKRRYSIIRDRTAEIEAWLEEIFLPDGEEVFRQRTNEWNQSYTSAWRIWCDWAGHSVTIDEELAILFELTWVPEVARFLEYR